MLLPPFPASMASTARLFLQISRFRHWTNPPSLSPMPSSRLLLRDRHSVPIGLFFFKAPLQTLLFHSDASSAVADVGDHSGESSKALSHPWPEWQDFIDGLKRKGYFDGLEVPSAVSEGEEGRMNCIKVACLSFARERFDILKSLSKKNIQALVECGCPNLRRKSVNSAKRLRAYLQLDEGDVCSGCNQRSICDRAYVISKEDEGARTVDVVRVLMNYATDPLIHLEGEKDQARVNIEASVRKLLSELTELSETERDPSLPKPVVAIPRRKEQPKTILDHSRQSQQHEMKNGDWICSKCNFVNFSRNLRCLKCREEGPERVNFDEIEMKKGDWTCSECQFMNFARNKNCFRCLAARPKRQLNPGDWECPSCDFLNFGRNMVCLKCSCKRPKDDAVQYEDHALRKLKSVNKTRKVGFGDDGNDRRRNDRAVPVRGYDEYAFGEMKTARQDYSR